MIGDLGTAFVETIDARPSLVTAAVVLSTLAGVVTLTLLVAVLTAHG